MIVNHALPWFVGSSIRIISPKRWVKLWRHYQIFGNSGFLIKDSFLQTLFIIPSIENHCGFSFGLTTLQGSQNIFIYWFFQPPTLQSPMTLAWHTLQFFNCYVMGIPKVSFSLPMTKGTFVLKNNLFHIYRQSSVKKPTSKNTSSKLHAQWVCS